MVRSVGGIEWLVLKCIFIIKILINNFESHLDNSMLYEESNIFINIKHFVHGSTVYKTSCMYQHVL